MCLQAPGLGMYLPASPAAASLFSLVLQDLSSPPAISWNGGSLVLQAKKWPAPVDFSSVIWAL